MNKIKIIFTIILAGVLLCSCHRNISIKHGEYWVVIPQNYKSPETNFYPFDGIDNFNFTGYKTLYAVMDLKAGGLVFDTISSQEKGVRVYEAYFYNGLARLTRELGYFTSKGFTHSNKIITDIYNWQKQIELGLSQPVPQMRFEPPLLSNQFELDTTLYTSDDVEYLLEGFVSEEKFKYGIQSFDSVFTYIKKDGWKVLNAKADRIYIKTKNKSKKRLSFWGSEFQQDLSNIEVIPTEKALDILETIPDSLLNSKPWEFAYDSLLWNEEDIAPTKYYSRYVHVRFKDGNFKTWLYHRYYDDEINILWKYPFMMSFTQKLEQAEKNLANNVNPTETQRRE